MIEVSSLTKRYGDLVAVDGVTFAAKPREIYGLLGPNGAGKSTIIGCISGLLKPDSGNVRVLGHDVVGAALESRRSMGIVPQELAIYEDLSAAENLRYWGGAYGLRGSALTTRIGEVLERVGLADRSKEACKSFSGGMKRRLNFACGVVHRPQVLLLDEPTVGVDPQSRVRLLELVREEAAGGACVLYTTHYMEEAETLCDRLAIIDHGRLMSEGTLADLHSQLAQRDLLRLAGRFEPARVRGALAGILEAGAYEVVQLDEASLAVALPDASRRLPAIFAALAESGAEVRETTLTQPNLESLFIKLTGKALRE